MRISHWSARANGRSRHDCGALVPRLDGTGAKDEATRMMAPQTAIWRIASCTAALRSKFEAHGGIDRDLEGLVCRTAAEQEDDREAREGEEEDDGGEAGQGAADRRPVEDREALPGAEAEALAGLEPGRGEGIEPREEDAGGEGAIEDDVRGEDAAEAEERNAPRRAEDRLGDFRDPAGAAPDREEAEGDDEAGGDDRGREEADEDAAAGKGQPVERPGQGDADDQRQDRRQARLDRRHPQQVPDVDAARRAAGLLGRGGPDRAQDHDDERRDRERDDDRSDESQRPPGQG